MAQYLPPFPYSLKSLPYSFHPLVWPLLYQFLHLVRLLQYQFLLLVRPLGYQFCLQVWSLLYWFHLLVCSLWSKRCTHLWESGRRHSLQPLIWMDQCRGAHAKALSTMKGTRTSLTVVVETVLSEEGMRVYLGINKLDHAIWVGEGLLGMMKDFGEKICHGSFLMHKGMAPVAEMKSVTTWTK